MKSEAAGEVVFRERVRRADAAEVRAIVRATGMFNEEEIRIAGELVLEAARHGERSGYRFVFAEREREMVGYACFGRVPATVWSWDLYWIAVRPQAQGGGLGRRILAAVEERIVRAGGGLLWVETSSRDAYKPTCAFYRHTGFRKAALLENYYGPGDSKVIFVKRLPPGPATAG